MINYKTLKFYNKTFEGIFTNFKDISSGLKRRASYNSKESEQEEFVNAKKYRKAFDNAKLGIAPDPTDRYTLLCSVSSTLPNQSISILDVGGGAGHALSYLTYSCQTKKINLAIYELPVVVSAGRVAFRGIENIHFEDNLNAIKSPIDIVFFGSSFQYFEDYQLLLHQIKALSPKILIIIYTPMTNAPTFITAQVNMQNRVIPTRITNYQGLINFLKKLEFEIIYRSTSKTKAHFRNFTYPQSASSFYDLMFVIKKQ